MMNNQVMDVQPEEEKTVHQAMHICTLGPRKTYFQNTSKIRARRNTVPVLAAIGETSAATPPTGY
eukprot:CAMPEP_0170176076 /NCGR_PEP_ID=MMETSP0040_2-20121228/9034_1 /TAXON_ID=641309 /ORGANISM="Lotharella oceanica, Strain CCMP622" /LENGTH=64 /DNA_ID=CAMNT_0010418283 /DNA_START=108 /DNA_END=302 /DNA_ORIENTATION=-